jgi:hypothetical protein
VTAAWQPIGVGVAVLKVVHAQGTLKTRSGL